MSLAWCVSSTRWVWKERTSPGRERAAGAEGEWSGKGVEWVYLNVDAVGESAGGG